MYLYRYTTRPARIGAVLAHTLREALDTLSSKVDEIQQRLEAYDESIDETPKAKAKRKQRAKKGG